MLFKLIEVSGVFKDVLILHDDVKHDQAAGWRSEIHAVLVVLVLTKYKLCFLRVVQALEKQATEKHAHFLAKLEREPKVYEVGEAGPRPLLDFWSFNAFE